MGAAGELLYLVQEEEEPRDPDDAISTLRRVVEFEHVKFGCQFRPDYHKRDFSASVKPGQKIAIVGRVQVKPQ